MIRLEQVLASWKSVRQDTIAAVLDFPAAELDYRPAEALMSFREIARHILDSSDGLTGLLLAGEDDFATPAFRRKLPAHIRKLPAELAPAELGTALGEAIEQRTKELAEQSPEFFSQLVTRFDGERVTRLEMLQTLKEHELTHRAQLFLYLRLKGGVPPTTRRRLAKQAGQ
jgi:uncharacterized damage-inducible protein DinB